MSHCYNLEGVFEIRIMSVLVYGGQGALGRVLVNRLKANYKVISVDLREWYSQGCTDVNLIFR